LLKQERKLQQQIYAEERYRIERLLGQSASAGQIKAINEKIDTLLRQYHDLGAQMRKSNPRYAELKWTQPPTIAEIQQQALDQETLLLEYALGGERSFLWAVTPTSLVSFVLPKRAVIEAAAQRVSNLLTARNQRLPFETDKEKEVRVKLADAEYPIAAAALSRMLLGPVAGRLGGKRLLIVSDGELHSISFAALPSPHNPRSFTPLIVDHEIIHLPSASTLVALRRDFAGRAPAARSIAVLADPVFNQTDERVKAGLTSLRPGATAPSANAAPSSSWILANASRLLGADATRGIPRLKHTRQEADGITAPAPAGHLKALDFKASRATATSAELGHYRFVHFATHGFFDREHPEMSGLLFSLVSEQGQPQNGLLQLHEVYNLKLNADLVVLSACQTALGKVIQGEGLVGLTRGFMYAGAHRVVASLWEVNDPATAELMERFYQGMLRDGLRPAAALRKAQEAMWRRSRRAAPFYWAAFILQGEWK
jgi:CHAT domain-containing protein